MDKETITALSTGIAEALRPVLKQCFAEAMPPAAEKTDEDKKQEEMAAAGVAEGDDDKTKQEKVAAFRAGNKKVSELTTSQFAELITKGQMQFFRSTGGKPVKIAPSDDENAGDPFENRVQKFQAGGVGKALAINLARKAAPQEYNAWMAKKHPNVQHMAAK